MSKHTLPIFLCTNAKSALVVGGGGVALRKVEWLRKAEVAAEILAPEFCAPLLQLAANNSRTTILRQEEYTSRDLGRFLLAIAATDNRKINHLVAEDAARAGIPVNVADCPDLCTFFVPAMVARGPLKLAVGTDGMCPSLAAGIRADLEHEFPEYYADFAQALGKIRMELSTANLPSGLIRQIMSILTTRKNLDRCKGAPPHAIRTRLRQMADNILRQEENRHA